MNHHNAKSERGNPLQRKWFKRIGAAVAAALCAMLGLALVARADVAYQNPTKPMNVLLVPNADGSNTLTISGEWLWPSLSADCNVDRYAIGWAVDWKDPDPVSGAGAQLLNPNDPTSPKIGDATSIYPLAPADPNAPPIPVHFREKQRVFYNDGSTLPRCGVYGPHTNPAGSYSTGTWGPISHTYAESVTSFSACVLLYDLKGPGVGAAGSVLSADPTLGYGGFLSTRAPIATGTLRNTDNSREDSAASPFPNKCIDYKFLKSNLTTQASVPSAGIFDTAKLSNVPFAAGGDVTFKLYGPSPTAICSDLKFTSTVPIVADPSNPAGSMATSAVAPGPYPVGNYWWVASYFGGSTTGPDLGGYTSYLPTSGTCGDPNESFTILPPNGNLILRKEVDKAPATDATFTFSAPCLGALSPVTLTVPAGQTFFQTMPFSLVAGTECVVTERSGGDSRYTLNLSPQPAVIITEGAAVKVTITNTEKRGGVTVTKKVVGALSGDPTDFTYTLTCGGVPVAFGATGNDGVLTNNESETYSDIAMGAKCSVTESPSVSDVFISSISPEVTISSVPGIITITNTRKDVPVGKLRVHKVVTVAPITDASFTFTVTCTNPAATYTVTAKVLAGQLSADSPDVANIPAGSSCTVQETAADTQYFLNGIPSLPVLIVADKTSEVEIVNKRATGGRVFVQKVVSGRLPGDPADPVGGFTFDLTCGGVLVKPGGPDKPSGQVKANESIGFFEIPTRTVCSAVETNVPSMFTSTVSGPLVVDSGASVEAQTITITNTRRYISIPVTKNLSGGVGPAKFGFTLKCIDPPFEAGEVFVNVAADQTIGSAAFTNVPADATCTVTESTTQDGYSGAPPIQFKAGSGPEASFTNRRIVKPGTLLVEKKVDVAPTGTTATFDFSVDCPPAAEKPISVTIKVGELLGSTPEGSAIPAGTQCTVTETLADPRYSRNNNSHPATIAENQQSIVTFENIRRTGTVKVTKVVQRALDSDPKSFPYTLTCGGVLVAASKGDGNGVLTNGESESYAGIVTGTLCVAAEPDVPGVFVPSFSPSAGVVVASGDNLLTITNTRKTGKLVVEKTVTSAPTGNPATFTFLVECPELKSQTVSVTVTVGETKGTSTELSGIPTDVVCKVTEQTADDRYSLNATPTNSDKVQEQTRAVARITNTRLTGKVTVEKVVVGGFSSDPDTFKYTLTCGGKSIVVDGIVKVSDPQTTSGIETGTICTAKENDAPAVFTSSVSAGVTVGADTKTITITNTRKVVSIPVSKTLQGGVGPAEFGFTLNCSEPTFGPISKTISIGNGLSSGQETFTLVPLGARCNISESKTDSGYLPASGVKTVVATLENPTVAFTNTMKVARVELVKNADRTTIRPNELVTYTVAITNRGNYDLPAAEVTVKDDHCTLTGPTGDVGSDKILSVNETWTHTCAVKLAVDTTNKATVEYPGGSKEATRFVDVINPGIQVSKVADKTTIHSGTSVTYTYKVTNTGDDPLLNVLLKDDICGPVVYISGDVNANSKLEKPEEWTYTCKQVLTDAKVNVEPNIVLNTVTATGVDSLAGTVSSDKATASVVIIHPSIALRKSASASTVHSGDVVTYTFVVSNTGDSPVSNVTVVDDKCSPLSGPVGDTNGNAKLDLLEFWTYTCSQVLTATTTNVAKANGKDQLDKAVAERNATATVRVIDPGIQISKVADKTLILSGEFVTYTYQVTNTGDDPLSNVSVKDDVCGPAILASGDTNANLKLETSETWTYTCKQALTDANVNVKPSTVLNTATSTGVDSLERTVPSGKATASVVIIHPSIALRKSASASTVHRGDLVTYTFVVSNAGDSPVSNVSVVDDKCKPLSSPSGDVNGNTKLEVGELWTYTCTQALTATTTNVAKANGKHQLDNPVAEKTSTATVTVIDPSIAITKSASSTAIIQGASVTYTYKVTNTGGVALIAVVVTDDKCSPLSGAVGDDNGNAKLETAETWTYTCTQVIGATTTNTATVVAFDPLEKSVTAQAKATVTASAPSTTSSTTTTTTTTTTTAPPLVAALVFPAVPQTSSTATTTAPTTAPAVAAPGVVVPASVLAATLPQAPPANVLGVQVSKTEPAFTGSGSTTHLLGFLGLIALVLGCLFLLSPRVQRTKTEDR
jgi:uncharacterized repeat protein (TIGR01451 family)